MNNQSGSWGFTTPDGLYQPLTLLDTHSLFYAGRSLAELQAQMQEDIEKENYESCARLRDEISRRQTLYR